MSASVGASLRVGIKKFVIFIFFLVLLALAYFYFLEFLIVAFHFWNNIVYFFLDLSLKHTIMLDYEGECH